MKIVIAAPPRIVVDPATRLNRRETRVITWSQGDPGPAAKISYEFSIAGVYAARTSILPSPIVLPGNGTFTAARCFARAFDPCLAPTVWDVTKGGTFASEAGATDLEIANALWATITFPAGAGEAVWQFFPDGSFSDRQIVRIWQSATPDNNQDRTAVLFAGD